MQLDLFQEDDIDVLNDRMDKLESSTASVRRGIFARHNELARMYLSLKEELDELRESMGLQRKQASIYELFGGERAI